MRNRKKLLILAVLVGMIVLEPLAARGGQTRTLQTIQKDFQGLKIQFERWDRDLMTRLTDRDRADLDRSLRLSARQVQEQVDGIVLKARNRKLIGLDFPALTRNESQRSLAVMEACIDYIIMLAMQMKQSDAAKDKDVMAEMLSMLEDFERSLNDIKAGNIEALLKAKSGQGPPDLAIDYFGINSTSAIKGGNYVLSLKIKNIGNGSSSSTMVVFSGSPEVISIYGLSSPKPVPPLDPGQTHTLSFDPTNNSLNIPTGNYTIHAVVNPNEVSFKESSFQNNENTFVFGVIPHTNVGQPKHKIPETGRGSSIKD
jgi:hypothetical protein